MENATATAVTPTTVTGDGVINSLILLLVLAFTFYAVVSLWSKKSRSSNDQHPQGQRDDQPVPQNQQATHSHHPTHTNGGWWGAVATSLKSVLKKTLKAGLVLAGIAALILSIRVAQLYSEDGSATLASGERAVQIENGRFVRNGAELTMSSRKGVVRLPGNLCVRWMTQESGVSAVLSKSMHDPTLVDPNAPGQLEWLHFSAPQEGVVVRFRVWDPNPVNGCRSGG